MTIEYHINQRDELITFTMKGSISPSEACVQVDEMLNDADFDANLPQLVDLREAHIAGSKTNRLRFEKFLLGDYRPRLKASVAIVVNPQWDEDTCAQAFLLSCALHRAELFDDWGQACKWLIKKEFSSSLADIDAIVNEPSDSLSNSDEDPDNPPEDSEHQAEHSH